MDNQRHSKNDTEKAQLFKNPNKQKSELPSLRNDLNRKTTKYVKQKIIQ